MRPVITAVLAAVSLLGSGLLAPGAQAASTGRTAGQTGLVVSSEPSTKTPQILDGTVYSLTQVGNQIVVGGSFTHVQDPGSSTTLTRQHVLSFNATTGVVSTTFVPNPNGVVRKVQAAADGKSVYVGGHFTRAGGSTVRNLFLARLTTRVPTASFKPPSLDGDVRDLEVVGPRLWVAGKFKHIGTRVQPGLGTLVATTGAYNPFSTAKFAGVHNPAIKSSLTDVLQISANRANTQLMAVGNFTSVNGYRRSQIVKLDISRGKAAVATWRTQLYTSTCSAKFETYVYDVEFSPTGSYFVVSTSGAYGGAPSLTGRSGCDVVARFEAATTTLARPTWTSYTGGDSTWTVEVTNNAIYAGGHQRWQNNPTARDAAGQGAVARTGIAALNPLNGMPYSWNPTRTRGVGVQDLLANDQGLYVGSDTESFGSTSGNQTHKRIAFLPLAGGETLRSVSAIALPADVYTVATTGSTQVRRSVDGTRVTATADAPGDQSWATAVGAFMLNGKLYTATSDGALTRRSFDGSGYGAATPVDTADAVVRQSDWHDGDVPRLTSLFYARGKIYFTLAGDETLYRRAFEVSDDIVGQLRFGTAVSGVSLADVHGAFLADGRLFWSDSAGRLLRATWSGDAPVAGSTVQVSGPGKDTQSWSSRAMFALQKDPTPAASP